MTDTTRTDDAEGLRAERGTANSHIFDDGIYSGDECIAFSSEPWTGRILAALTPAKPVEPATPAWLDTFDAYTLAIADRSPSAKRDDWLAELSILRAMLCRRQSAAPAIPAGMVAWHGGDSAPADWDGGPVFFRMGRLSTACEGPRPDSDGTWIEGWGNWHHRNGWDEAARAETTGDYDVVAYSRKPAAPAVSGDDAREALDPWRRVWAVAFEPFDNGETFSDDDGVALGMPKAWPTIGDLRRLAILADPACRLAPAGDGEKVRVLTEALEKIKEADFLDYSLHPERSACAIARAVLEAAR